MDTVLSHHVLPDTMPKLLVGLVNHVTQLVLNVPDQPTDNVFIVIVMSLKPTYKTDIVSVHKVVMPDIMPLVVKVIVNLVMLPVVLVTVLKKLTVPLVVITYSTITTCVVLNVHLICIQMLILTFVKFVMKPVLLVTVQMLTNV
jgi:hypothetical protein